MAHPNENLQPDDLDEYVAECDEHLSAARRVLLDLESSGDLAAAGSQQLDGLFRAFHTIKGLSGMVGAKAAEEVSHGLEAYLGHVRNGNSPFTQQGIDVLLEGIGFLENAVATFQDGGTAPDPVALAVRVGALMPSVVQRESSDTPRLPSAPDVLGEEKRSRLIEALQQGKNAWRLTFIPNPASAARGMNVNTVRSRLQAIGEIIHAQPIPTPGGIRFQFILVAPAAADLREWAEDGIELEPYQPPSGGVVSPARSRPGVGIAPANLVRVDLARLDDLMRGVGELVLSRARLEGGLARVAAYLPAPERRELEETAQRIERQLRDLREGVMRVRTVPVRDLFARMRMVVRDLIRETGKEVELVLVGEETEIDKLVIERMADPFLHLVRNAVSHGLESASEREKAGKSPKGRITLRAAAIGGIVILEVEDDGRGVRVDEVFARARAAGLVPPDARADPGALLDLLCTPGFSTRDEVDRGSGRGVGMDVVRLSVEALGGSLTLDTRSGLGSCFTARLPLTLVVADVLTVAVGDQIYAVPRTAVREVVPVEPGSTTILENNELIRYHGGVLPLVRLGDILGLPRPQGAFVALVTGEGSAAVALAADRAIGLREVVVRALSDPLVQVAGIGGATELGDGRPILILDPGGLARLARRGFVSARTGG